MLFSLLSCGMQNLVRCPGNPAQASLHDSRAWRQCLAWSAGDHHEQTLLRTFLLGLTKLDKSSSHPRCHVSHCPQAKRVAALVTNEWSWIEQCWAVDVVLVTAWLAGSPLETQFSLVSLSHYPWTWPSSNIHSTFAWSQYLPAVMQIVEVNSTKRKEKFQLG